MTVRNLTTVGHENWEYKGRVDLQSKNDKKEPNFLENWLNEC
jgi:hypothetical protein